MNRIKKVMIQWVGCGLFCCLIMGAAVAQEIGDVDGNGAVNIIDALKVAQYSVGLDVPGFDAGLADVNSDGTLNIVDALVIAQYYVGILDEWPLSNVPTPIFTPVPTPTQGPCATICPCGPAMVEGYVRNSQTEEVIPGAYIHLEEVTGCRTASATSAEDGFYGLSLYVSCTPSYVLTVVADGYQDIISHPGGISCSFYEPRVMDIYMDPR